MRSDKVMIELRLVLFLCQKKNSLIAKAEAVTITI